MKATTPVDIGARLSALRERLRALGLSHYLVPSADEHANEYLPQWRKRREWLTGFTGSAGDVLVAAAAGETRLFTDGRYHLQAEEQLRAAGGEIALEKVGAPGSKTLAQRLAETAKELRERCVVGYDPGVLPIATVEALERLIHPFGARLRAVEGNLVDAAWDDRPSPATSRLLHCPLAWAGATPAAKIEVLRAALNELDADAHAVVKLDQIAWLLNLRSQDDVPYNPVFEAFLYVDARAVHLFVRAPAQRLPADFAVPGLEAHEYDAFLPFLRGRGELRVALDPDATTQAVLEALAGGGATIVRATSPIERAKAVKNAAELACMERANLRASAAKTAALRWLDERLAAGEAVTEATLRARVEEGYAAIAGYRGLSFDTIAATGAHGAIIHYGGADDTPVRGGDLVLVDSGIQFDGGTTDDTRTVIAGTPSDEQRRVYTLVLAAHAAGARAVFPEGTSGAAIDALTRAPLWAEAMNYDHGTGHGVGAWLNVHEGPFALAETRRRSQATVPLAPGMVTSIEPGYYRAGFGGVRLENLYVVEDTGRSQDGRRYFRFRSLTWIPFDERLIDWERLAPAERRWVEDYQAECRVKLEGAAS